MGGGGRCGRVRSVCNGTNGIAGHSSSYEQATTPLPAYESEGERGGRGGSPPKSNSAVVVVAFLGVKNVARTRGAFCIDSAQPCAWSLPRSVLSPVKFVLARCERAVKHFVSDRVFKRGAQLGSPRHIPPDEETGAAVILPVQLCFGAAVCAEGCKGCKGREGWCEAWE